MNEEEQQFLYWADDVIKLARNDLGIELTDMDDMLEYFLKGYTVHEYLGLE